MSNQFAAAGITPSIISIGNEIRGGLLWPTGKYDQLYNIARLLNSAAYGIKDSKLSPKPKISKQYLSSFRRVCIQSRYNPWQASSNNALTRDMEVVHLDNGWDWSTQEWFYSSVLSQGPLSASDFDMMGVSFYPVSSEVVVRLA